jgi:glutaredoxin
MNNLVTIYSRHGCHLCEVAETTVRELQSELGFNIDIKYVDNNPELEKLYGHEVPVIHIDGEHHDFFRVDPERLKSSLEKHRQRQ